MAKQQPAPDLTEVRAVGAFLSAASRLQGVLDEALQAGVGVSYSWFALMIGIADTPDQRLLIGELGRRLSLTSGGVTRFVDRVEAAGLVTRVPSRHDRRALYVTFTDHGRDVVQRGAAVLREVYLTELVGPLTKAERTHITSALPRIGSGSVSGTSGSGSGSSSSGARPLGATSGSASSGTRSGSAARGR